MRILAWITSFLAWLQIAAAPLIAGLLIGFVVYYNFTSTTGLVVGVLITVAGLVTGIMIATRIWRTRGAVDFISRVSASPDLDNLEEVPENESGLNKKTPHQK